MKWTNNDVKIVEKFINIKNRGYYANGNEVTEVYNRVLEKNAPPTNCGSCIRQRILEMENALNQFKKQMENKAISSSPETKTKDEVMKERMAKVRAARKPKNEVLSSNVNESKNDASEVTQQQEQEG